MADFFFVHRMMIDITVLQDGVAEEWDKVTFYPFWNAFGRKTWIIRTIPQSFYINKLMGLCKKDITPLLIHWSYVFLALTHWNMICFTIPTQFGFQTMWIQSQFIHSQISVYEKSLIEQVKPWFTWWYHDMEMFSAILILCEGNLSVTVTSTHKELVMRKFDAFFVVNLTKLLSKQFWCQWFEIVIWDVIVMKQFAWIFLK